MAKTKREKKPPEPHWNEMVRVFFEFTRSNFNDEPSFTGSAPRNLKNILRELRTRAEARGVEWTLNTATTRLRLFLQECLRDKFLYENWILHHIDREKDKIFFSITRQYLSR